MGALVVKGAAGKLAYLIYVREVVGMTPECPKCHTDYAVCDNEYCKADLPMPHCSVCGWVGIVAVPTGIEVISGGLSAAPTLKGSIMLSTLRDAQTEAQNAISEINDKIEELQNAIYEIERFEESVTELIDSLENVDGMSVSVDVDSFSLDLDVNL